MLEHSVFEGVVVFAAKTGKAARSRGMDLCELCSLPKANSAETVLRFVSKCPNEDFSFAKKKDFCGKVAPSQSETLFRRWQQLFLAVWKWERVYTVKVCCTVQLVLDSLKVEGIQGLENFDGLKPRTEFKEVWN